MLCFATGVLRGGGHRADEDLLTVFRFRVVQECTKAILNEVDKLKALLGTPGANPESLGHTIKILSRLNEELLDNVGDKPVFDKPPPQLRKID
jgi:hypothetical protein